MKTSSSLFFFFFFFFLFFAFITRAELVFDSDGEPLRNGGKYYLSPPNPNGGLVIFTAAVKIGNPQHCSLAVIQIRHKHASATTIETPLHVPFMSTAVPLNISFTYFPPNICTNISTWLVIESQPLGRTVMLGDAAEFPESVVKGWFYIKRHDNKNYKLVFCSSEGDCGDIGIQNQVYSRLVVTNKKPLVFKIDKVKESLHSDISMVV